MELWNKFRKLFWQRNKGFDAKKELEQIERDKHTDKKHYSDLGGELEAKFGADAFPVINPSGEYGNFLPINEYQNLNGVETMACTVFATLKAIQIIIKLKYGITTNYSERFIAILAGISPTKGGSPHNVAETIRKYGLIPQEMLPFTPGMSSREFYTKPANWNELLEEGKKWLKEYDFGHEWIFDFRHENIAEKRKTSPTPAGVAAWFVNSQGIYYKPPYASDNHWCLNFGELTKQYYKFQDSYEPWEKHIDWNYPFAFMKRYYVGKKTANQQGSFQNGKLVYEKFLGKRVQRYQVDKGGRGQIYFIGENLIQYIFWQTNDHDWMQKKLEFGLNDATKKGELKGITEAEFADLTAYCVLQGKKIETLEDIKGQLEIK